MKKRGRMLIGALVLGGWLALSPAGQAAGTPHARATGSADHRHGARGVRGRGFDRIAAQLGLSHKQKPKVRAIFKSQLTKIHRVFRNRRLSRQQQMKRVRSIRAATSVRLKRVLTPDQYRKWEAMSDRRRIRPMHHRPASHRRPRR